MSHRSLSLAAAAALVLALAPLGVAQAAGLPTFDVWVGKTHQQKLAVNITHDRKSQVADVYLSLSCTGSTGQPQAYGLTGAGKIAHGKLTFTKHKAFNGVAGTLTVHATVPATRAATGTISWSLPASYGSCTGHDTFKLKHGISHGG
jgi:hypothetical protein